MATSRDRQRLSPSFSLSYTHTRFSINTVDDLETYNRRERERELERMNVFMREKRRGGHFWKAVPPSLSLSRKVSLKKEKEKKKKTVSWRTPREKHRPSSSITHETTMALCAEKWAEENEEPRVLLAPWPLLKAVAFFFSFFLSLSPFYYYCTWKIFRVNAFFFYFTLLYSTWLVGMAFSKSILLAKTRMGGFNIIVVVVNDLSLFLLDRCMSGCWTIKWSSLVATAILLITKLRDDLIRLTQFALKRIYHCVRTVDDKDDTVTASVIAFPELTTKGIASSSKSQWHFVVNNTKDFCIGIGRSYQPLSMSIVQLESKKKR